MTDTAASLDQANYPLRVRDFYLGRQPVPDRNQALYGYELLFRSARQGEADETGLSATAAVIAHAAQLGLARAIGDAACFLNVDAEVLASDIFAFLPRERTVLEIVSTVVPDDTLLARMRALAGHGFRFALDGVDGDSLRLQRLLPLAAFVKLDLRSVPPAQLPNLVRRLHGMEKTVVAEKVETRDTYQAAMNLGFDYFQGYYFAKPAVLSGKKLSPSQLAIMQLMQQLASDVDNAEIESSIKKDITLCFNLLRLVNTPAAGARRRIDSVSQALMVLGRSQLRRWLQIMLYAEPCKKGQSMAPLLTLAATRGKLLELIAEQVDPQNRNTGDTAFTVGIMSLMNTLFSIPMSELLEQIPVVEDVADALLHRRGRYGEMLRLVEQMERIEEAGAMLDTMLDKLHLSSADLVKLQIDAFEWSDQVARSA